MPRSFDMATEYETSVAQVHRAFSDQSYWLARLAESGADEARLDSFQIGRDGGIDVVTTQVLHSDRLPGVIHQFHRGDLEIRRAETWTGVNDGRAEAVVASSIAGAPGGLTGSADLEPWEGVSRLVFRGSVEVRVPLVGRKLENFIGNQLMELLTAEQRFTTSWITENH